MRQEDQVSRYEVNRNVRMVVSRHDADLTRIDYSFMGSTVYLSGDLARPDGDFSAQEVEIIAREIAALPYVRDVQFDLNNWVITTSGDSWQVNRARKQLPVTKAAAAVNDSTHIIEKAEDLADVLDDLEPKATKKKD